MAFDLETIVSYSMLGNAIGDLVLSSGIAQSFMEENGFKDFDSPHKALVVNTFTSSLFIHGLVRLFGARNLKDPNLRLLVALSYMGEIFQAAQLTYAGALGGADRYFMMLGPILPILYLLTYKEKTE